MGPAQYTGRPRLASYAHRLDPHSRQSIAILTGSRAWARAESRSCWFHGCRLLLPWHEPPEAFLWPVEARDCCLFCIGEPEPLGILEALSVELIQSAALFVIWVNVPGDGCPATLYRPEAG